MTGSPVRFRSPAPVQTKAASALALAALAQSGGVMGEWGPKVGPGVGHRALPQEMTGSLVRFRSPAPGLSSGWEAATRHRLLAVCGSVCGSGPREHTGVIGEGDVVFTGRPPRL